MEENEYPVYTCEHNVPINEDCQACIDAGYHQDMIDLEEQSSY